MRIGARTTVAICGLAVCLIVGATAPALAQAPGQRGGGRGFGGFVQSNDPRVQNRTYHFADTNEDLPYCVFASSKVSKDRKAPLVVSLHGLGIGPGFMCQGKVLDLAEEGGYILVAPMGYNPGGWYGSPVIEMGPRGGGPAGAGAPAPIPADKLAELSEKDVLNVLATIRKEFKVDDDRTYLIGHSMGGAGTLFLGSKYAKQWAAIAPIAAASFRMTENRSAILQAMKDAKVPVMMVHGDADTVVPVSNTRTWVETMKELKMDYEYKEIAGAGHGDVIDKGMPDIFAFLKAHTKSTR